MKSYLARFVLVAAAAVLIAGCSAESKKARALERVGNYFKSGDYEKAEIECRNVLQLDPENAQAIEHLGMIWLERGALLRALPFFTKIRVNSPANRDNQHRLLQITLALGKLAETRREATALLQRFPDDKEAIVALARAARSLEDYGALEKALKKADRSTAAYHIASARLLLRQGDAKAAKLALQRALGLEPNSPQVRTAMAEYYFWLNHPNQIGLELKAAAELAPLRSNERVRHAEFLLQTGAAKEAKSHLMEITQKAPDYFPAWRGLAYIALAEKKPDEALVLLGKIFSRDPSNYEAQITRAQVWVAQGEITRAIEELEKLGIQFPGAAEDKFVLGQAYLQNGDPAQAMGALKKAVAQNPDHPEAVLLLSKLSLAAGEAEPVAKVLMELLANQPNMLPAQMVFLDAMKALGRLESVAEGLRAQIKTSPERVDMHLLLGMVLNQQQKPADARKQMERALELAPDLFPLVAELVSLDLVEKNFAAALQRAQKQIAKTPASAPAHFLEARVFAAEGKWDEAEAALFKTLELDSEFIAAYNLLASGFLARQQSPQGIARLDAFLEERAGDLRVVLLGGNVYAQLKQFEKSRLAYEKYLSAKPDSPAVLNNLAFLYAEYLDKADRGLELARQARKLNSRSPEIADTLGWILFKRKEYPEALELFKESAARSPKNAEIQYHLGLASQKMGQNEIARTAFQKAARTSADFVGKDQIPQRLAEIEVAAPESRTPPDRETKSK